MLAINQAEQHVKGLEEMIDHAPEFQKASPSELLKTVGYELWNLCVEQSKKKMGNSKYESSMKFQLVRGLLLLINYYSYTSIIYYDNAIRMLNMCIIRMMKSEKSCLLCD